MYWVAATCQEQRGNAERLPIQATCSPFPIKQSTRTGASLDHIQSTQGLIRKKKPRTNQGSQHQACTPWRWYISERYSLMLYLLLNSKATVTMHHHLCSDPEWRFRWYCLSCAFTVITQHSEHLPTSDHHCKNLCWRHLYLSASRWFFSNLLEKVHCHELTASCLHT